jgi:RHH-type rel operon transcriptional repressor/antitoxin RelB
MYSKYFEGAIMLAIRLPEDVEARLDALAKATGRTKTFYAREAILEHIDDLEDIYLADQIKTRIRQGKEDTVSLDDLMRRYGLDG